MAVVHDDSEKCCRRCHSTEHLDFECRTQRCGRCEQVGHAEDECQNSAVCILCKSTLHLASECQFNWAKPKISPKVSPDKNGPNVEVQNDNSDESLVSIEEEGDGDKNEEKEDDEDEDEGDDEDEDEDEDEDDVDDEDEEENEDIVETVMDVQPPREVAPHHMVGERLFSQALLSDQDSDTPFIVTPCRRKGKSRPRSRSPTGSKKLLKSDKSVK